MGFLINTFSRPLSSLIHVVVILLVVSRSDIVHPSLVVQVPTDGFLDAFLKLEARLPAQFLLELGGVDGVAHIVASAIGDVGNEVHVGTLGSTQQAIDGVDDHLDDIDVLPLVEAAYIVGFCNEALVEDEVDGTGVVLDEQPVAHIFSFTIHGQRLAVADVVDEQRNQLLRDICQSHVKPKGNSFVPSISHL